jgi:hypothetical protein
MFFLHFILFRSRDISWQLLPAPTFMHLMLTTGKMMILVRFNLCRAHIFGRMAKRGFAVRIFHGAR